MRGHHAGVFRDDAGELEPLVEPVTLPAHAVAEEPTNINRQPSQPTNNNRQPTMPPMRAAAAAPADGLQLEWTSRTEAGEELADQPVPVEDALKAADSRGHYHRTICFVVCACAALGGMAGGASPFVLDPVTTELRLAASARGLLGSAMFIGMWLGSVIGGPAADTIGPGRAMLCGVGGVAVSGALPAALPSPSDPASLSGSSGGSTVGALVILSRMAAGFSLVIIYQSGNSYLAESVPTSVRNAYATVLHVAIAVGGLLTTGLASLVADERWRALLALNSSPAFAALLVVGPFVLGHESPRWLLVTGREESACRLVQKIAAKDAGSVPSALRSLRLQVSRRGDGGKAEDDGGSSDRERLRTGGGQGSCGQRLRQLCHPSLLRLHAVGCTVAFCLNFGSKGFETWLGSYVRGLGMPQLSTTVYFGAIAGKIVGDLINMAVGQRLGRLRCLQLSFAAAGVCVLLLCFTREPWALVTLACGQGAFVDIIWCNVYLYLAEAFPTSVRSTAFGLTMGVGRSGGVISASLGGMLSSVQLAFVLYAASFFVGAACIVCFGLETSRRPLADVV